MPPSERKQRCPDCAVEIGEGHLYDCDVARCLFDGSQRLICRMWGTDHDCGQDVWTGYWPGILECQKFGFWCYWGPTYGESGFVRCDKDHPDAMEDLNRLLIACDWNPTTQQWELKS
jgi:hypothetical protein